MAVGRYGVGQAGRAGVLRTGLMWILVLGAGFEGAAAQPQTTTPQSQTSTQPTQPAIPDAPKPQTLPGLRTITPVGAAITAPDAPVPQSTTREPGATLPASPTAKAHTPEDDIEVPPPAQGPGAFVLRGAGVTFVEVPFTVKDSKGQLLPGLKPRDVRVFENGLLQKIDLFTVDPFPLSVAVVIDQSVTFDTMTKINNALGALQGAFTPSDEVAVFTYNNGVKEQTPFTGAQSARLGVILERSKGTGREPVMGLGGPLAATNNKNGQNVDVNTSPVRNSQGVFITPPKEFHTLNDAILAAAAETKKAGAGRRRIVYVISDGKEYGSKAKEKDVIKYLQTNKVTVFATVVGESSVYGLGFLDRIHLPLTMRDDVLPRYTAATGGQCDPEFRQKGIETSFAKITEQVRTQYTIGYSTHESVLDGKYRSIDVRVARPNVSVIAKAGYYPSVSDTRPVQTTPTAIP